MTSGSAIISDLRLRGLIQDHTDESALRDRLDASPMVLYAGFDPTADSLHVGNLVPLLLLRRFQLFGHRPIAVAGGATGMVGDPGGRSAERTLLERETLDRNLERIKVQLKSMLEFDGSAAARLVDNRTWTEPMGVLEFLRDVGKHVTVNTMLAKESVRSRVESQHGISFTEFSYMLLQANDYVELHRSHGCELQVGGSDQWGNITAGIEMIRRRDGASVHGLTVPLVTRSDGAKFGKSVDGAIWLDPDRTLPYEFHQYWLRTDDRDVDRFLRQLTLLPVADIEAIVAEHEKAPDRRLAQQSLADEVTALVHGDDAVSKANRAAEALFGGLDLTSERLDALRGIVPETVAAASVLSGREAVVDVLVTAGVAASRGDARRAIDQGGVQVNGRRIGSPDDPVSAVDGRFLLIQKGKKTRHLVVVQD